MTLISTNYETQWSVLKQPKYKHTANICKTELVGIEVLERRNGGSGRRREGFGKIKGPWKNRRKVRERIRELTQRGRVS